MITVRLLQFKRSSMPGLGLIVFGLVVFSVVRLLTSVLLGAFALVWEGKAD